MKNLFSFILLYFFISAVLTAQKSENILTDLTVTIHSANYIESKQKLNDFIISNDAFLLSQREGYNNIYVEFFVNETQFKDLVNRLLEFGYVTNKEIKTSNYSDKILQIKLEVQYLNQRKKAYEEEIAKMAEKNDRYYSFWEEIRQIETRTYQLDSETKGYESKRSFRVNFSLNSDEEDFSSSSVVWVNKPGVEYSLLRVETPMKGLSVSHYQGFSLKYLFTEGKTFATLGAMKSFKTEAEDGEDYYKELFMVGFGQDFYTRHFGRGKNRFLNLYTGYHFGGLFATGEERSKITVFAEIFLGLELFKNKYILLDNKVGYFIPWANNRNLRGISYRASFNFVF